MRRRRERTEFLFPTITIASFALHPLSINGGSAEMKLQGGQGVNYVVQVLSDLGGDNRWVTLKPLGAGQTWVDPDGLLGANRFYRAVWVQPTQ